MYDGDIEAIIMNVDNSSAGPWTHESMQVATSTEQMPNATIELLNESGTVSEQSRTGSGPVEAAFKALEEITGVDL